MLWWGRFDPEYSRNRILRKLLLQLGWRIVDFRPVLSGVADLEARLRRLPSPDLVWVPCFRQRDYQAARRWSRARGVSLVFDPLISAYDKQIFERAKLDPDSAVAHRLLSWERKLFQSADLVIADTTVHADFFADTLGVAREKLSVVYVGAEESLFKPEQMIAKTATAPIEVLFYGSFIPLHGAEIIAEAVRRYGGPPVHWRFIGKGPSRARCEAMTSGLNNVTFEDWVSYADLPAQIQRADVVLGVFGTTQKAARVIPNKVYQALACARPVITRRSPAYPPEIVGDVESGIIWVNEGDPEDLCKKVSGLASAPARLSELSSQASNTYQHCFSSAALTEQLRQALCCCVP